MPISFELASQIQIKINGSEASPDVMANLLTAEIDQHAHLPDMFTLYLQDPELALGGPSLIDNGPFDLTKEVEIGAEKPDGSRVVLMKGEITAMEPAFQEGMIARLVVRGYDTSHRLYREMRSVAHLNKKDSDLASEIAGRVGLQADVEATSTVYDHVFQHNQSDLAFLQERAWRIGYECFVEAGSLIFRSPPTGGAAVTLTWGEDLLSFHPRMNLAEQVDEVVVRGWSAQDKRAIVGRALQGELYPRIGESRDGAAWARSFGSGKQIYLHETVASQAEANTLAEARLNELSGAFIQAEGIALRRPDIRPGRKVTLEALGTRFSGTYLVTTARHTYSPEGFKTVFGVRGLRTGQLIEEMDRRSLREQYPGVVVGVVTNTDDPQRWGRVKVQFPWMVEEAESDWARVVSAGAGPEAGLFVVPEVGDEVVVAFEQGDFRRPYVLGGVWNGQDAVPPVAPGSANEHPKVRSWHSRTGHHITVYDDQAKKIEIVTGGGHRLVLDDANREITVTSSGGITLTLADSGGRVTLEATEIEIQANGNLSLRTGGNIDAQASGNLALTAGGQITIKGAVINLN
jgi:phage protein D/phage baseplate assembly protein gpV